MLRGASQVIVKLFPIKSIRSCFGYLTEIKINTNTDLFKRYASGYLVLTKLDRLENTLPDMLKERGGVRSEVGLPF